MTNEQAENLILLTGWLVVLVGIGQGFISGLILWLVVGRAKDSQRLWCTLAAAMLIWPGIASAAGPEPWEVNLPTPSYQVRVVGGQVIMDAPTAAPGPFTVPFGGSNTVLLSWLTANTGWSGFPFDFNHGLPRWSVTVPEGADSASITLVGDGSAAGFILGLMDNNNDRIYEYVFPAGTNPTVSVDDNYFAIMKAGGYFGVKLASQKYGGTGNAYFGVTKLRINYTGVDRRVWITCNSPGIGPGGSTTFVVHKTLAGPPNITVTISVSGDAQLGADYTLSPSGGSTFSLTLTAAETPITIVNTRTATDGAPDVTLTISAITGSAAGYTIESPDSATTYLSPYISPLEPVIGDPSLANPPPPFSGGSGTGPGTSPTTQPGSSPAVPTPPHTQPPGAGNACIQSVWNAFAGKFPNFRNMPLEAIGTWNINFKVPGIGQKQWTIDPTFSGSTFSEAKIRQWRPVVRAFNTVIIVVAVVLSYVKLLRQY